MQYNVISFFQRTIRIWLSERSQCEKATDCMIPTIWHSRKGKTTLAANGGGRRTGRAWRIFKAVKLLCILLQWWVHVTIHLSKPTECTPPRVNPNVNYGAWVMTTYQRRFIDYNKCTPLVQDADSRGGSASAEAGGICEIAVPFSQFYWKPKTALIKPLNVFK